MNRWRGWWTQAERDLKHAKNALEDADFEWSAFAENAIDDAEAILEFCRRRLPRP